MFHSVAQIGGWPPHRAALDGDCLPCISGGAQGFRQQPWFALDNRRHVRLSRSPLTVCCVQRQRTDMALAEVCGLVSAVPVLPAMFVGSWRGGTGRLTCSCDGLMGFGYREGTHVDRYYR